MLSFLDLYSGVKVAPTSTPLDDQYMMNRYTIASLTPPHWWSTNAKWTLWACQLPLTNGPKMKNVTGISISAPVT